MVLKALKISSIPRQVISTLENKEFLITRVI